MTLVDAWSARTQYADKAKSSACTDCAANTIVHGPDSSFRIARTACTCEEGFWIESQEAGEACEACPPNARCAGQLVQPHALPRFWVNSTNFRAVYECSSREACPGGIANCSVGYHGALCAHCVKNYFRAENRCVPCTDDGGAYFYTMIAVVLVVAVLVAIIMAVVSSKVPYQLYGTLGVTIFFFQTVALLQNIRLDWPQSMTETFRVFSFALPNLSRSGQSAGPV